MLFISEFLVEPSSNELYLSEGSMLITLVLIFCDFNYPNIIQQLSSSERAFMENTFSFILNGFSFRFVDSGRNKLYLAEPLFSWVKYDGVWLDKSLTAFLLNIKYIYAI